MVRKNLLLLEVSNCVKGEKFNCNEGERRSVELIKEFIVGRFK